jgi:hypothetical protein
MKSKSIALLLFALVLTSGCVNRYEGCASGDCCTAPGRSCAADPSSCCPGTECLPMPETPESTCRVTMVSYWESWQSFALVGVLISAFFVALAYMAAYLLGNQMLLLWAKNEFFQVMVSAFIIGTLIVLLSATQQSIATEITASGVVCSGDNCHILLASRYLQVMYEDAATMSKSLITVNTILIHLSRLGLVGELTVPPYFGSTVRLLAGLSMLSETLTTALDIQIKAMMLMKAQQVFLEYVQLGLYPVLLVMGIVLRTFFFTRKIGGLLIAIAIGIYLFYPLVYVFAHNVWLNSIHRDRVGSISYGDNIETYLVVAKLEDDIIAVVYPSLEPGETGLDRLLKTRSQLGGLGTSLGRYVGGEEFIGDHGFLEKTGILLVYSTFIPFIALMSTIGFVRGLSPLLGGDIEIAGLTRLL